MLCISGGHKTTLGTSRPDRGAHSISVQTGNAGVEGRDRSKETRDCIGTVTAFVPHDRSSAALPGQEVLACMTNPGRRKETQW